MRPPTQILKSCASLVLALLGCAWQTAALAQPQAPESELKAAIIANMLLFVEWPSGNKSTSEQLTLCYLDNSPVSESLALLHGKTIKGKSLDVVQSSPEKLGNCHALYLSPSNGSTLARIANGSLGNLPVLLIGDTPGFLRRGIMVNLEQVSGRIIFDIDLGALQASRLKLSSKALRLARQVVE